MNKPKFSISQIRCYRKISKRPYCWILVLYRVLSESLTEKRPEKEKENNKITQKQKDFRPCREAL